MAAVDSQIIMPFIIPLVMEHSVYDFFNLNRKFVKVSYYRNLKNK